MMFIKVDIRYRSKYARKKFAAYRYVSDDRFGVSYLLTEDGDFLITEDGEKIVLER